jgi:hypothetical protein
MSKLFGQLALESSDPKRYREPIDESLESGDNKLKIIAIIRRIKEIYDEFELKQDKFFRPSTSLTVIRHQIKRFNSLVIEQLLIDSEFDPELRENIEANDIDTQLDNKKVPTISTADYFILNLSASSLFLQRIIEIIEDLISKMSITPEEKVALFRTVLSNKRTIHGISCLGHAKTTHILYFMEQNTFMDFSIEDGALVLTQNGYERLKQQMSVLSTIPEEKRKYTGCLATEVKDENHKNLVTIHTEWILGVHSKYYIPFSPQPEFSIQNAQVNKTILEKINSIIERFFKLIGLIK